MGKAGEPDPRLGSGMISGAPTQHTGPKLGVQTRSDAVLTWEKRHGRRLRRVWQGLLQREGSRDGVAGLRRALKGAKPIPRPVRIEWLHVRHIVAPHNSTTLQAWPRD